MRIKVITNQKKLNLRLPNRVILSKTALKALQKENVKDMVRDLSPDAMKEIRKTVREMKKLHPGWKLLDVDVADAGGERVQVEVVM